jgi:hypothetical protein
MIAPREGRRERLRGGDRQRFELNLVWLHMLLIGAGFKESFHISMFSEIALCLRLTIYENLDDRILDCDLQVEKAFRNGAKIAP